MVADSDKGQYAKVPSFAHDGRGDAVDPIALNKCLRLLRINLAVLSLFVCGIIAYMLLVPNTMPLYFSTFQISVDKPEGHGSAELSESHSSHMMQHTGLSDHHHSHTNNHYVRDPLCRPPENSSKPPYDGIRYVPSTGGMMGHNDMDYDEVDFLPSPYRNPHSHDDDDGDDNVKKSDEKVVGPCGHGDLVNDNGPGSSKRIFTLRHDHVHPQQQHQHQHGTSNFIACNCANDAAGHDPTILDHVHLSSNAAHSPNVAGSSYSMHQDLHEHDHHIKADFNKQKTVDELADVIRRKKQGRLFQVNSQPEEDGGDDLKPQADCKRSNLVSKKMEKVILDIFNKA
jgi:hypothetical protein